jgi:hypothetical protein
VRQSFISDSRELKLQLNYFFWSNSADVVSTFLGYKLYRSNLVTPCGTKIHHGAGPDMDARDLSGRDCDTLES